MRLGRGAVLAMVALGVACNAVLGTEDDYQLINGARADQCLLNSDCAAGKKCIFKTCSVECNGDQDCQVGLRCLKEGEGSAACVSSALAACVVGEQVCPTGTTCKAGSCRNECVVGQVDCLSNQVCVSGVCVGLSEPPDVLAIAGVGMGGTSTSGGAVSSGGSGGIGPAVSGGTTGVGGVQGTGAGGSMGGMSAAGGGGGVGPSTVGAVGQPCVTGSYGCAGHAQRQQLVCQGGFWVANGTCQAGDSCDTRPGVTAGTCGPIVSDCVGKQPTEVTCQGTSRVQCDEDLLSTAEIELCSAGCVAGLCTTCLPTAKRCTNNAVETCDVNGAWGTGAQCTGQVCVAGECTGACTTAALRCSNNAVEECNGSGEWAATLACTNQACVDSACIGACTPSNRRCVSNAVETCDLNGSWGTGIACSNQACVGSACIGVCTPGSKRCINNAVETCDGNGAWGTGVACSNMACVGSTCIGVCTPTAKRCMNNAVETCDGNGAWGTGVACSNQACVGNACVGVCTPGTKRCTSNAIETCDGNGSWGAGVACTNQACVSGACTGICTPLSTQCADKFGVQTCSAAGAWGGAVDCTNQACVSGACTGSCDPDTERCSSNTPQRCNASGVWADKSAQCSSPSTICKFAPPNTSCVSNPPYYVGESAALTMNSALAANYLFAMPLVISAKTRFLDLGLIGRTSSSAFVTMALYTDVAGQPGALLQSTTEKQLAVGQVVTTPISALTVSAGTYWLVAIFNANANSYEVASGGASYRYVSGAYATFPANFPASTLVSNTKLNFYARVQDQP